MMHLRTQFQRRFFMLADTLAIGVSFAIGYWARKAFRQFYDIDLLPGVWFFKGLSTLDSYYWILLLIVPIWLFWLNVFGLYKPQRFNTGIGTFFAILQATLAGTGSLIVLLYAFQASTMAPRSLILLIPVLTAAFLMIERAVVATFVQRLQNQPFSQSNLLIVGTGPAAAEVAESFQRHPEWGFRVLGFLSFEEDAPERFHNHPVLGVASRLSNLMHTMVIDHVVVSESHDRFKAVEDLLLTCEEEGVPCSIAANFFNLHLARADLTEMDGQAYLVFTTTSQDFTALFVKRTMDIVFSALALAILLPLVFLPLAIAIRLDSKGQIFFSQIRSGLNGRPFKMWKFRSMVNNAEQLRAELESRNEQAGPVFKIKEDPRITRIGRFIRRTSLDELPQLFNVLLGEMSIVGPRPPIPAEVEKYERWQKRRLSMRPGLTCVWQVSGRNRVDFDNWMRLDLQYIDQWSLWLDIKLILQTVPVLLKMEGQ